MARASFISLYNTKMTIGQEYRVQVTSYDSTYLHKIVIKCGSYSMTFDKVKGGVEKTFTVPLTWANAIPNATSLNGTITLTTYQSNYSTKVGANDVQSTTFNVPSSIVPTLILDVSEAVSGIADKFDYYIQSRSKLKVEITANGAYGSTIKSYKTTIEGVSYSKASFTSNTLTKSGTVYISTTITDSRGRTATKSNAYPVLPYTSPTIYTFMCNRTDKEGNLLDEGTYLKANINFAISEVESLNDSSYSLHYKLKESEEWINIASGNVYSLDSSILSSSAILDINSSYDIRLTIQDYFTTRYAFFEMGTAFTLIDFNANGKALAFGKVSEREEGVEFGIKAFFENGEVPNGAIAITNSTDLNDIMDEGYYYIPDSSVASSVLNKPYDDTTTGLLTVLAAGSVGQRLQIYRKCSKDKSAIWERYYYGEAWGDWLLVHKDGKVLWSGGMYMTGGHVISFSEKVSEQVNGISLVFSEYVDGEAKDQAFINFFISKEVIKQHSGYGYCFNMCTSNLAYFATKYLYIRDDGITGHNNNNLVGTSDSGISYTNNRFVLRYVIGV